MEQGLRSFVKKPRTNKRKVKTGPGESVLAVTSISLAHRVAYPIGNEATASYRSRSCLSEQHQPLRSGSIRRTKNLWQQRSTDVRGKPDISWAMATSFSDGWPVETALCRVELRSYERSARAGGGAPRLQRLTATFHGNPNTRSISSWKNLTVYCFGAPFGRTSPRRLRHASLQYFTCSQSRAHFRRH